MRTILGVIAGLVAASLVFLAFQWLSHELYPPAAEIDLGDPQQLADYMAGLPAAALVMVLLGYLCGSLIGGWLAARIARLRWLAACLALGVVLTIFGVINLMSIPHPTWFAVLNLLLFIPAVWAGGRMAAPVEAQPG